jgi:hypothetical protein
VNSDAAIAAREEAARVRVEARIAAAVAQAPPFPRDLELRLRELIVLSRACRSDKLSAVNSTAVRSVDV